jgi:hypothetical protein
MKISKRRLNTLIENYLFEAEEGSETQEDNKVEVKVKPMTIEIGPNSAKLTINKKTGGVTLKVTGVRQGFRKVGRKASLSSDDVAANNEEKAVFVKLALGYIQDLMRHDKSEARSFIDNLKSLIDLSADISNKAVLAWYDNIFNIKSNSSVDEFALIS